ncbi:MAG: serine/threonine protein kinase [Oscillospiraceae bacterium]|nr:serine/threonine protein kinase [Oscillospiraceae bacterium]
MYGKQVRSNSYINRTYRITEMLGSGGSCAVYKAWHNRLRKYVVIKIADSCSTDAIAWHRNEVEALKNIKSMYLPQVIDFLISDDQSFTIMEHIEGLSFDKLLKCGHKFTEVQILKWYMQLALALTTIHKHDVSHRDIKPANIILTTNDDICLIDFNSAFVIGNNTGIASRSMGYASPEQYEYFMACRSATTNSQGSHNVYDVDWKLSDIFSLGATIYHLLTGERLLTESEDITDFSNLKGFNKRLISIIMQSTKATPSQRFASAEELYNALRLVE